MTLGNPGGQGHDRMTGSACRSKDYSQAREPKENGKPFPKQACYDPVAMP
jgi:hypothetical protein